MNAINQKTYEDSHEYQTLTNKLDFYSDDNFDEVNENYLTDEEIMMNVGSTFVTPLDY